LTDRRDDVPAWRGDWRARLEGRIRSKGFGTPKAFLDANRGRSYVDLARMLALAEDVAPVQLEQLHRDSAGTGVRPAALDSLTRFLRGALRSGWGNGKYWQSSVTGALASWTVMWGGSDQIRKVKEALFAANPPIGWIPEPDNDPLLSQLFDQVWPVDTAERTH
jgi:hypothetical protein